MSVVKQTWHTTEVRQLLRQIRDEALWETALMVVENARANCPRRYGYLAASIMAKTDTQSSQLGNPTQYARLAAPPGYGVPSFKEIEAPNQSKYAQKAVNVGTSVDYAPYVEYRVPFLRPAAFNTVDAGVAVFKQQSTMIFKGYLRRGAIL